MVRLGLPADVELLDFLSKQYDVPSINLGEFEIDKELVNTIPREVAEKYCFIPFSKSGSTISVAMSDPSMKSAIEHVRSITGCDVEVMVAKEESIRESIDRYYTHKINGE